MNTCEPTVMANERARALRRNKTSAEQRLWWYLRGLKARRWKFRQQVPIDDFIVDFCCLSRRLIVEVDGDTHGTTAERAYDAMREAYLVGQGFRIVRFWNSQIREQIDAVMDQIVWILEEIDHDHDAC